MPINSTLDVVIQQDDLVVLGPPDAIDISLDIGPQGEPGSQIYVGDQNPNALTVTQFANTYGQAPQYRDLFIRNDPGAFYGTFYVYTASTGDSWESVVNTSDIVEAFFMENSAYVVSASAGGTGINNGANQFIFNRSITFNGAGNINLTLPTSGSVAVWQDKLSNFSSTTSSELASVISDETGTGSLVFNTNPNILSSLTTSSGTFNLLNSNATTINFGGQATDIEIGAQSGTTNINNNLEVSGNVILDGSLLTNDLTISVFPSNATTVNFATNASTIEIGSSSGTTSINNNLVVDGTITGNLLGNANSATQLSTARTIQLSGDVSGIVNFDGSQNINISTSIESNSVNLGSDTNGNYIATVLGTPNQINVSGSGAESADITLSLPDDVVINNNLTIGGNLIISGSATYLNTIDLYVNDNIIQLNSGVTGSPILDAGIQINRGTSNNVDLRWNESTDSWQFTNNGSTYHNIITYDDLFAPQLLMSGGVVSPMSAGKIGRV